MDNKQKEHYHNIANDIVNNLFNDDGIRLIHKKYDFDTMPDEAQNEIFIEAMRLGILHIANVVGAKVEQFEQ